MKFASGAAATRQIRVGIRKWGRMIRCEGFAATASHDRCEAHPKECSTAKTLLRDHSPRSLVAGGGRPKPRGAAGAKLLWSAPISPPRSFVYSLSVTMRGMSTHK